MKRIAGNCRSDGRIALNKNYYEYHGLDAIWCVLLHELCHHYCFEKIGRHNHSSPLFLDCLNKVGSKMKGLPMPVTVYIYSCPSCMREWSFRSKLRKVVSCSKCSKGKYNPLYEIQYINEEIAEPICKGQKTN